MVIFLKADEVNGYEALEATSRNGGGKEFGSPDVRPLRPVLPKPYNELVPVMPAPAEVKPVKLVWPNRLDVSSTLPMVGWVKDEPKFVRPAAAAAAAAAAVVPLKPKAE